MVQNLSQNVVLPVAGVILAFVMTLELVQILMDKNNFHDIETVVFFRWIFKTACAILIVTNTWNIVMGIFDVAQGVVNQASGVIIGDTGIDLAAVMPDMETRLRAMDIGPLLGLWVQSLIVGITMWALTICIFIITYGRMLEIYLVTSMAPIPMAAMLGREWGGTEEDALLNQYMKQSRIDGYFDGDTFVRTSSEPVKLILKNDISKADLEKFRGELAEKGLEADIDWQGVKEDFVQIGVGFDNIERFEQKADYLASRYAVLKDRIQTQFTGEHQEAELQKLEQIYTQAKEEMANTYAESIGGFFEDLGQSGAAEDILSMKIRNSADIAIPTTTQPHIQKEQTFFAYSVRPSPKAREITEVPPMPKTVPTAMKIRNTGGRQRYRRHQNVIVGLADKKRICQIVNQHHQHSGHSRQGIF